MHHRYFTIEQRETLAELLRSQRTLATRRETALERLHQPDYGVCVACGGDIGFVLLKADPWALHCRACRRLPVRAGDEEAVLA